MKRTAALYVLLTLLVWGLFAFDQGLFHDDAANLAWAQRAARTPGSGFLAPIHTPTRRLLAAPYILAWASPEPAAVLQLFLGGFWLLSGFAVFTLARRLFPASRASALMAGALALTATSDLLTNSSVGLGYCFSGLTVAVALTAALRFQEEGRLGFLAAAMLLLNAGLFASDGATPAAALAPLLLLAVRGRPDRRWAVAAGGWLLAMAPYGVVFVRFLMDPGSYAAVAFVAREPIARIRLSAALVAHEAMPWRWAFRRPVWIEHLPPLVPVWVYGVAALTGAAAFLATAAADGAPSGAAVSDLERRRNGRIAAVLVLMIAATHLAFSGIQLAEVRYRTHLVTRLLTALLLALATDTLARRLRAPRRALALPAFFVGLGVAGGVERQDTYLATWTRQRRELSSILQAVPALDARATLVLSLAPDPGGFQATRVPYLAAAWASLLWDDPSAASRLVVELPGWGATCRRDAAGLACAESADGRAPVTVPWDRLVLLSFEAASGRYLLVPSIPASGGAYRPQTLIRLAPLTERTRTLLAGPRFLGRLLPGAAGAMLAP